jgi:Carboxypeptidase regulatory-like domain
MPLNGATITIQDGNGNTVAELTSNSNGYANWVLMSGTYTIIIAKAGYTSTSYQTVVAANFTQIHFNLPTNTTVIITQTVCAEGISEVVTVVAAPLITSTSLSEVFSVAVNPAGYILLIIANFDDSRYTQGVTNPAVGQNSINGATTVKVTTRQYSVVGSITSDIGGLSLAPAAPAQNEAVNTSHNVSIGAQSAGSYHILICWFKAAWELNLVVSPGGWGTINALSSGTIEVIGANSYSATESPIGHVFSKWLLDGAQVSTSTTYVVPAQVLGSNHTLTAVFV